MNFRRKIPTFIVPHPPLRNNNTLPHHRQFTLSPFHKPPSILISAVKAPPAAAPSFRSTATRKKAVQKRPLVDVTPPLVERSASATFQYNIKLNKLAHRKDSLSHCLRLFDQMRQRNVQPDKYTYSALLTSCARARAPQAAFEIYHDIRKHGIPLDFHLRSSLLKLAALQPNPQLDLCSRLFHGAPRPNRVMCNVMMDAYASVGSVDECISTFRYMNSAGIEPDRYTVSALTKAYIKANRTEEGIINLTNMKQSGLEIPSSVFSNIISEFGQRKQLDRAVMMYDLMTSWSIPPDQVTFNVLIRACAHAGDVHQAMEILEEMRHTAGFNGDRYTFHALIQCYLSVGDGHTALHWYKQISNTTFHRNQVSYRLAFKAAGQVLDLNSVYAIVEDMKNAHLCPREDTLATLMAACIRCSDLEGASFFFKKFAPASLNLHRKKSMQLPTNFFAEIRSNLKSLDHMTSFIEDYKQTAAVVDEIECSFRES